jgi:hypothetical protein
MSELALYYNYAVVVAGIWDAVQQNLIMDASRHSFLTVRTCASGQPAQSEPPGLPLTFRRIGSVLVPASN